ncbi:MAG: hypothetical protein ACYTBS_17155, partial [Planctomycetota bacterium]
MTTFMKQTGIEAQDGQLFADETLQSHFGKDTFSDHQLSGRQIRYFLSKSDSLTDEANLYSVRSPLN